MSAVVLHRWGGLPRLHTSNQRASGGRSAGVKRWLAGRDPWRAVRSLKLVVPGLADLYPSLIVGSGASAFVS